MSFAHNACGAVVFGSYRPFHTEELDWLRDRKGFHKGHDVKMKLLDHEEQVEHS